MSATLRVSENDVWMVSNGLYDVVLEAVIDRVRATDPLLAEELASRLSTVNLAYLDLRELDPQQRQLFREGVEDFLVRQAVRNELERRVVEREQNARVLHQLVEMLSVGAEQ